MNQSMDMNIQEKQQKTTTAFWCLLAAAFIDFLIIVLGPFMDFYLDEWLLIPSCLYLFAVYRQEKTKTAQKVLLLGGIMCTWYVITQLLHHCMGLQTRPLGMVLSVYLLALPFAAVARDERRGLKIYMGVFLAAMVVVLILTVLATIDCVPRFIRHKVYFWKNGIIVMIHPSQLAGFLLVGIAFTLVALSLTKNLIKRILLLTLVGLLSITLVMTKSHTAMWMMYLLYSAYCFFAISRGGLIRFLAGVVAAVMVFGCSYSASQAIFKWYVEESWMRPQRFSYVNSWDDSAIATGMGDQFHDDSEKDTINVGWILSVPSAKAEDLAEAVQVKRFSLRDTLDKLLPRLNGRKGIWLEIYDVMKKDPQTILFGTDYTNSYILEHTGKDFAHSHNSWIEALIAVGLPGLFIVALMTAIAFWHIFIILFGKQYELWQKSVALLEICLLAVGAMEPHLFLGGHYLAERNSLHPSDFTFFLCLGYMIQWRATDKASRKKRQQEVAQEIVPAKE